MIEPEGQWRAVLDALPVWVLLVDDDVRILDFNRAAADLLGPDAGGAIGRRGGDVLHCIHAGESAAGCGHAPHCQDCIVRNAVRGCFVAGRVTRRRSRMQLRTAAGVTDFYLLVTAAPVSLGGRNLAVLVLEDISELTELERIIPICSGCRKVKLTEADWQPVESHFSERLDMEFTHGLCPDCLIRYGWSTPTR